MLETATSERPPFICDDGLDECMAEHRIKLLNSLDQIPTVGHSNIRGWEIAHWMKSGRVTRESNNKTMCIASRRGGILKYRHMRLDEYSTRPDDG